MVALLFPWPVVEAVADDAKERMSPSSTNTPHSSRSVSDDEESEVVDLSSMDEEIELHEWIENARLKAEIERLARKNLDLRIQVLDKENALLRARIADECVAQGAADMGQPEPDESAESAEEATSAQQLVEKISRNSRRRANKKAGAKVVRTAAFHAPLQNSAWHPWMGCWPGMVPFQPSWQIEPDMKAVVQDDNEEAGDDSTHEVDDEEPVVILDDSAEEEEEEEEDDDDEVEIIEEDGVCQAAE